MKKQLLVLSMMIAVLSLQAQITITSADVQMPYKIIRQSQDTMPTVSSGSAGASQTWNMSALNTHTEDTLSFISPSWTGDVTTFPSANLAIKNGWGEQYAYALNSSSSLTVLGNRAVMDFGNGPTEIKQYNTPSELLLNFPSNYLSSFNNNFTSDGTFYLGIDPGIGFVIDSVRQKSVVDKSSNCDAWGNITTPLGTFAALRFLEIRHQIDTVFAYSAALGGWFVAQESADSSKKYTWWANSVGFPIVEVDVDYISGSTTGARWLQELPFVGVEESAASLQVNVYPNPASSVVNFELDASQASAIRIFDITGRMIRETGVNKNLTSMDAEGLANGSYTYSVIGRQKQVLSQGRFVIAR